MNENDIPNTPIPEIAPTPVPQQIAQAASVPTPAILPNTQSVEPAVIPTTTPTTPPISEPIAPITVVTPPIPEPVIKEASPVVPSMRPPSIAEPLATPAPIKPVAKPKTPPLAGNASMVSEISRIAGIGKALGEETSTPLATPPQRRDPIEEARFGIKSLRTYEEDVASLIRNPETTVAKVVIAEQARQEKVEKRQEVITRVNKKIAWKNILYAIMSVVLLAIAGGLGFGIFQTLTKQAPATEGIFIGIIETESKTPITYTGTADFRNKLAAAVSETTPADTIREFIFTTETVDADGVIDSDPTIAGNVLDLLALSLPEGFIRSLDPEFMIGEFGTASGDRPFMILFTKYYQSTYAGMLRYEDRIVSELSILGWPFTPTTEAMGTTTSTIGRASVTFIDEIIENRDVRRGIDRANNTMLIWSFINKDTLIIAPDVATFTQILDRLNKRSYIR